MKSAVITFLLVCGALLSSAQKPLVIKVEKLKAPDNTLPVQSYQDIVKNLIRRDHHVYWFPTAALQAKHDPEFNIVAKNKFIDSLVNYGYHSFFSGMYNAYASHRPFTLSPDMIWLLICQGFANHVNNNSEQLRPMFVNFTGKTTLTVNNNRINIDNPNSPWEELFPEFSKQISKYTGQDFTDAMTADFTTTTPVTKMASQITTLYAMKSYFDFTHIYIGCGIPQITLEGTPADWQKVLDKTEALRKYQLDWWVDQLEPILSNFVKASKGKKNKMFWQTMFKYHTIKRYGARTVIDGWIVKFYPYSKLGKRLGLDSLSSGENLPDEIVKVDLNEIEGNGVGNFKTTKLELWAGFVGLKQNNKDFNLKPEIGWLIRKKDTEMEDGRNAMLKTKAYQDYPGIEITANTVPQELLEIGPIKYLHISFPGEINISDDLARVPINNLTLNGTISDEGIKRIRKLFPNTALIINNTKILE